MSVDLAVGVIIGAAFGKIVDSVVNDLIMPVIGTVFNSDFTNLYIPLSKKVTPGLPLADAKKLGPVLAWGNFITVALNFIILAFVIFFARKKHEPALEKRRAGSCCSACTNTGTEVVDGNTRRFEKISLLHNFFPHQIHFNNEKDLSLPDFLHFDYFVYICSTS
jgi:large conductance mechanosensitive channel